MKKHIRQNHIAKIHKDKDDLEPKYVETLESASKLPVPLIHLVVHTIRGTHTLSMMKNHTWMSNSREFLDTIASCAPTPVSK